ncbi:uncharacterized protein [Heterodontus francisci]|uniref:uncharacterized protein n=1 Tax=Heterodontus francisci TaxID=7792 RepID=UPI00355B6C3E
METRAGFVVKHNVLGHFDESYEICHEMGDFLQKFIIIFLWFNFTGKPVMWHFMKQLLEINVDHSNCITLKHYFLLHHRITQSKYQEVMNRITSILEELSADELEKFKQTLEEYGIPHGKLEKANVCTLVQLIKKQFKTEERRLKVIRDALENIPRQDLVSTLDNLQVHDVPDGNEIRIAGFRAEADPALIQPMVVENSTETYPRSGKRKSKDYGLDGKLRYSSILQIVLGLVIIILATTSAFIEPHQRFLPLRIPWWSGLLFSVIGIIPLLPLKKTEKCKLIVVLVSNGLGGLFALTASGLSIWNNNLQKADCSYHWLILLFNILELIFSLWNICITSIWLKKECRA